MNYGQAGFQTPQLTPVNKTIIIAIASLFILENILAMSMGFRLTNITALYGSKFFSGHIYELITYPWIGRGLLEVVFNGLLFWFIGSELESMWGRKRYLAFIAASFIGGGILYILISSLLVGGNLPLMGMAGVASSLCVAYGVLFPDRVFSFMMIIPIKAKYFCMLLVGMSLFNGIFSPGGSLAWGHLGSMLCAFLFMLALSKPSFNRYFDERVQKPKRKGRAKLKLVDDKDEKPPKYWH
jgi:membrane associated rhomboid family serine protease